MREDAATLDTEERELRAEATTLFATVSAREGQAFTDDEKTRDDEIAVGLTAIADRRSVLAREIANAEAAAVIERGSVAITSSVRQMTDDDPKRGFANLGDFAMAVQDAGQNPRTSQRLMAAAGTGQQVSVKEDGGVFLPPAFSTEIWDRTRMASNSLLGYTDNIPFPTGVESLTIPAINETSRADGSRHGGIRGYWKAELTSLTSSTPKYREVKFQPNELYVFGFVSDKMLRKAPGTASAVLTAGAADEINFKVGDGIFRGDGAGKPLGFLGHAATLDIAKETGQAAATVVKENIDKMYARCHANWRSGAVWFINQDVEPALEQLSATVGTGGVPVYLPAGGVADTPNARLKGLPVIPIEYCSTLGTSGDICLVNLNAYGVAVVGMVDSAVSIHLKFDFAQSAFRFIFEMDGQPWLPSAITPFKGTNTLSPILTLATRA